MNKHNYCTLIQQNSIHRKTSWLMNILVSLDQLGNAIAMGNPDNTVSARIGYFMHSQEGNPSNYWKVLESIVDFSFKPIDGIKHCFVAYCHDKNEKYIEGNILSKIILALLVIIFCIPFLIIVIRIIAIIFPKAKNDYEINGEKVSIQKMNIFRKLNCN